MHFAQRGGNAATHQCPRALGRRKGGDGFSGFGATLHIAAGKHHGVDVVGENFSEFFRRIGGGIHHGHPTALVIKCRRASGFEQGGIECELYGAGFGTVAGVVDGDELSKHGVARLGVEF